MRRQRTLAAVAVGVVIAFVCWQNIARYTAIPAVHGSYLLPESFQVRSNLREELAWVPPHTTSRPEYAARIPGIYPYSVVPGGLKNSDSLRSIAASDRAVARHYSEFNYAKAHLVRLVEPREVYVSYRIRDTIFWTRKKIRLQAGELMLTDGKITARAKCGNQVSDTAKPEISEEEPEEDVMEQPVALEPLGPSMPVRPVLPPADLPTGTPDPPTSNLGGFTFPFVPVTGSPFGGCVLKDGKIDKRCQPHHNPKVPEPSTMVLMASGVALVVRRYRAAGRLGTVR